VLQSQQGRYNFLDAPFETVKNFGDYDAVYEFDREDLGKPLYEFNFEQQARIVEWFFAGVFKDDELERAKKTIKGFQTHPSRRFDELKWRQGPDFELLW
jgi:hypothetical protein